MAIDDAAELAGSGSPDPVWNGIDSLAGDGFRAVRDKRLGIVTNHTGLTADGARSIDVLFACDDVRLDAIFAPEHGLDGTTAGGEAVLDGRDETTGLPVYGLFGGRDRPTPEQLHGLDVVLFDLQDVGCRFYTYLSTLGYLLEACAENGVRVMVLDRPNPIDGQTVEGPSSDASLESVVNYHPLPLRHGMTLGELARFFNAEREIGADLLVAGMAGWRRDFWFDMVGQPWVPPSPNLRDLTAAALYPGIGLVEMTNVSVGRGTDEPFHVVGAPWLDGPQFAARLETFAVPGVRYEAATFTPRDRRHPHFGVECHGARFLVDDNAELAPADLGLALVRTLMKEGRGRWDMRGLDTLLCRPDLVEALEDDADELHDLWQPDPDFFDARARYLLY